jgi:benzoyl-CoA reductase/2-hydroxyglutaryl-CoA dehydratase subunit BcrC/BadD/HgdB
VRATTAIADLTTVFEETFSRLGHTPDRDHSVIVTSWPSVPFEMIRAAGLRPVVARGASTATPAADAHLEADIFPNRLRHLVEAALTERLSHLAGIVVPRTSDPDYKCFLYLREFVRKGAARALPPTSLFDLLQSHGAGVRAYDVARTRALIDGLASASGHIPSDDDLRREITLTNAARAAARRLDALRRVAPRVTGTEVFPLLGAFWQMRPDRYTELAGSAADEIATRAPLAGARILLTGAPVDSPALHESIESHGAIVVAELSPWGSGLAGDDVKCDGDPIAALADKYRADAIGPRVPVDVLRRWFDRIFDGIDAVVVSLPPDDTVFGWDYPGLRAVLDEHRIPHVCLRTDPYQPLTPANHARLNMLVATATRLREARHG